MVQLARTTVFALLVLAVSGSSTSLWGQAQQPAPPLSPLPLSLNEAVSRGVDQSEEVRLATADVEAAATRVRAAQAARLPQVDVTTSYTRTFQSPFQRGLEFQLGPDQQFTPDPAAPLEERVRYLEENADNAVLTTLAGLLSSSLQGVGLGSPHAYALNLGGSQLLFASGRVSAAIDIATRAREAAEFTTRERSGDIEFDVRAAYYQALFARELEAIAEAALVQAESFLNQVRLRLQAGYASDLDVLRADVSLENLRPQLVEAQNARQLAELNLKRLVNVPLGRPITLTTPLSIPVEVQEVASPSEAQGLLLQRPAVRAAEAQAAARRAGVDAARAAYRPSVALQLSYGAQAFPAGLVDFGDAAWRPNGSATVGVQIPVFSGFQRAADVGQAEVLLRQSELQIAQLREAVQLEYEQARGERERARATIAARQRTVDQAQRVYDLTVLRFEQGQATQLEVSDARLSLLQARSNLAQALTDYYIATASVRRSLGLVTTP
jgi:outer membrane protein TolC